MSFERLMTLLTEKLLERGRLDGEIEELKFRASIASREEKKDEVVTHIQAAEEYSHLEVTVRWLNDQCRAGRVDGAYKHNGEGPWHMSRSNLRKLLRNRGFID